MSVSTHNSRAASISKKQAAQVLTNTLSDEEQD